jgi:hypothetical protein
MVVGRLAAAKAHRKNILGLPFGFGYRGGFLGWCGSYCLAVVCLGSILTNYFNPFSPKHTSSFLVVMDKLLATLISTAWGRNLIMWFFAVLVLGIACLSWAYIKLQSDLAACNDAHMVDQRKWSEEREKLIREQLDFIIGTNERVLRLEKRLTKKR